jgi:hypothetical protein
LFILGFFLKITTIDQILGQLVFHSNFLLLILAKTGLGNILGDFSQTHPVTLVLTKNAIGPHSYL